MSDLISRKDAIDALRYAQHRFTVADEAGGMGTVKWSEDVIYFAAAERVLTELSSAQPDKDTNVPCKDTISRQAAIDALCKVGCGSGYCGISCDDVKAIEQLPSAQPEPQWIPCSERLPEKPVLCCSKVGTMIIGLPVPNTMSVTGYNADGDVCLMPNCVAWMPLPEPYAERREG